MIKGNSKNGLRLARIVNLFLVGAMALAGCRHVQVNMESAAPDLKATETAIARSIVATITAQAPSPTATSPPTATPVVAHPPTATPRPPTPTRTVARTPSSVATGTATPTKTPTRPSTHTPTKTPTETHTPISTKTPTPMPPLTPGQLPCRVSLLSPPNGVSFGNETSVVTLQWQSDRALTSDEYFFVNVTYLHNGETWYDGTWLDAARHIPSGTQDTSWELDDYLCAEALSDSGCFSWDVAVKRRVGGYPDLGDEVECLSPTWSFCWSGCERQQPTSTPTGPTPTPKPPTATNTPPPYPPPSTETPTKTATATTMATWTPTSVATSTATAQP